MHPFSLNGAPGDHFGFLQYWSYAISRKIVILWILTGNQNQAFKVQNYEFFMLFMFISYHDVSIIHIHIANSPLSLFE